MRYRFALFTGSQKVIGSIPIFSTLIIKALQKCKAFFYDWSAHLECSFPTLQKIIATKLN
jgi:hypothetical protein